MSEHLENAASTSAVGHTSPPVALDANAVVTPEEKTQVASKLQTAHEKKDVADAAFKSGDVKSGTLPTTTLTMVHLNTLQTQR